MTSERLIAALPDFVAFVRRDGRIVEHVGGACVRPGGAQGSLQGRRLDELWPGPEGAQLLVWVRKALTSRAQVDGRLLAAGHSYDVRIGAQGRDRALCVIRALPPGDAGPDTLCGRAAAAPSGVDRRGFVKRFQQSVADATLRGHPLAVALVHVDGLADIARSIDYSIGEQAATHALRRLPVPASASAGTDPGWYIGQLGESLLAAVILGHGGRTEVAEIAEALSRSLREPLAVGDATFHLTPSIGVAMLGEDARHPQALLDCARAAMMEARRSGSPAVQFYSDTLHLRPIVRLDLERELREAIADDELQLRYVGRHDLASGRLVAIHAYLRWVSPLRGVVMPAQFLPIAENTGAAVTLSQWALTRLSEDWPALSAATDADVRISFGPLRHHLAADALSQDLEERMHSGAIDPARLEIRINDRALGTLGGAEHTLTRLGDRGVRILVDEFGRTPSSLALLSRLPIHALQVDRQFVVAGGGDRDAANVCRGVAGIARALGYAAYAAGIDDELSRDRMLGIGYGQGLGDYYGSLPLLRSPARKAPRNRRATPGTAGSAR